MVIRIEHGKGGKERYAMLSAPVLKSAGWGLNEAAIAAGGGRWD
jgi:hypothetical protein